MPQIRSGGTIKSDVGHMEDVKREFKEIEHFTHLSKNEDFMFLSFKLDEELHHRVHFTTVINQELFIRENEFKTDAGKVEAIIDSF